MKDEIIRLIDEITNTGVVDFKSMLICKMSPHSHPVILTRVTKEDEFSSYSTPVINTIMQRLKLILHENSKNK